METSTKTFYHRNLPHWHPPGRSIFLTWRLYGSLPQTVINQLLVIRQQLSKRKAVTSGWSKDKRLLEYKRLFAKVDAILDKAATGPLWLKEREVAGLVQEALLEKYAHLYTLWSYVVMANHLHVLLKPKSGSTIEAITKHLKGYTAREANRLLHRTGQRFWQDESFDSLVARSSRVFSYRRLHRNQSCESGPGAESGRLAVVFSGRTKTAWADKVRGINLKSATDLGG
jgi:REP element-mobilizing transposase RayT